MGTTVLNWDPVRLEIGGVIRAQPWGHFTTGVFRTNREWRPIGDSKLVAVEHDRIPGPAIRTIHGVSWLYDGRAPEEVKVIYSDDRGPIGQTEPEPTAGSRTVTVILDPGHVVLYVGECANDSLGAPSVG